MDLEKAFDKINRSHLWEVLRAEQYRVPDKLIRVIRSIYSQCSSKVRTQKIESEPFNIESGVRQGDVLSLSCETGRFIIFMDKCLRDIIIG